MIRLACLLALSAAVWLPGLGGWERLSYHEAFVAQGAREMLDSGTWANPTIGGRPWLEKPPLPWWLVVAAARVAGGVDEAVARFPSAIAATLLVLGVAAVASRHYGPGVGLLAGAVQATTAWTALRGRLAEADVLLACLITWAMVAFDRMVEDEPEADPRGKGWRTARWAFFGLLGLTSMVKGIGFGAVLILAAVAVAILWRRDRVAMRRLVFPAGWITALSLSTAWPMAMIVRHGAGALTLWTMHVADRLSAHPAAFAGEPWWEYAPGLLIQAMPWTPLALVGAWHSLRRAVAVRGRGRDPRRIIPAAVIAGDRLLWAWSAAPMALLTMATVKNAHYAISAQVPWSIWAALGLSRLASRLARRGWTPGRLRRAATAGFAALGIAYGLGFWLLAPRLDRRGLEWAFYESAARLLPPGAPVTLLYDDWDRNPYESPFGAFPHDLAVRLFYLRRPAIVARGRRPGDEEPGGGRACPAPLFDLRPSSLAPLYLIGRDRDRPDLEWLGHVEILAHGSAPRFDRTYTMFRITRARPDRDPAFVRQDNRNPNVDDQDLAGSRRNGQGCAGTAARPGEETAEVRTLEGQCPGRAGADGSSAPVDHEVPVGSAQGHPAGCGQSRGGAG
jgi:4-amino-4-deoxy-L-arabinose transferase-like glycosyltransferase